MDPKPGYRMHAAVADMRRDTRVADPAARVVSMAANRCLDSRL